MTGPINLHLLETHIKRWLEEDMPFGDVTTQNLDLTASKATVSLIAKEDGILCGIDVFTKVFQIIDPSIRFITSFQDGNPLTVGMTIGTLEGPLSPILMGERLALNLLQRLSGIATISYKYQQRIKDYTTIIVDTRKTTPGLRTLEKYAVRIGGCKNHRYCLSDAVMIKDNHSKAAGGILQAVKQIRTSLPHTTKIEVEVETLEALALALDAHVDIIMLDNMSTQMMRTAVQMTQKQALLEASGNMTLERLIEVAKTGVDVISVGALTHSVSSLDISLKFL